MSNTFEAEIQWLSPNDLIGYVNNVKQHPQWQIDRIASSIAEFGFTVPVVIDSRRVLIAGHGRLEAARKLGLEKIPVIVRNDLTPAQVKALRIADNKVAESPWDTELLRVELESLSEMNFNLELTGFSLEECDSLFNLGTIDFQGSQIFGEDGIPPEPKQSDRSHALPDDDEPEEQEPLERSDGSLLELVNVTIAEPQHQVQKGDIWKVGPHLLVVAEVMSEWQRWVKFLEGNAIFAPYPGPFVPLTCKAEEFRLIMVQPDAYIAGHILDQYANVKGAESVQRA